MRRPGFVVAFAVLTGMLCTDTALAQSTTGWPVYGGDSGNTRYSKLDQITTKNVQRLKVAWVLQLGTLEAQESTPLVIGDTLYVTSSSGPKHVFAVEAKTGTVRWRYSPEIPADVQQTTCCGLDNRGVAYTKGKIFVTRLDGYLVALDARTGKELWKSQVVDYTQGAAITSPPTAVKNLVVTGFAGGEYGVRGYISAFDQDTGKEVWRLYTVPATGEPGSETWKGDSWKFGGGAAWYVGSYDPQLNLLYYGTSNPAPWAAVVRGPDSSAYGDFTNLFTASTLAIDPDSGKIVWHYQSTPYDAWDYDGVNELVLADVVVGGQTTPVLFKADRNGFFYVLNRKTGKLISAEPYVFVNWATGVDKASGRPIEIPEKRPRLDTWARDICPNLFGGKNWEPMAYSPQTRLVYIPTFNLCMDLAGRTAEYKRGMFYLGSEWDLAKVGPGGHMSEAVAWRGTVLARAASGLAMTGWPLARGASETAPPATNPFHADASVVPVGRSLFNQHCSHCHAPNAINPDPSRDLRRLKLRYRENMAHVFYETVTEGRPTKGMVPWKGVLSEDAIWKIFTFLESVQREP